MLWVSLGVKFTPIASPLTREGHRRGLFLPLSPSAARSSSTCRPCRCTKSEEETFQVLTAVKTRYNDILVVDTPKSRMLLLDSTRTHSFYFCSYFFHIYHSMIKWIDSFPMQIMSIAFYKRVMRNGLAHIGYVNPLLLFFIFYHFLFPTHN